MLNRILNVVGWVGTAVVAAAVALWVSPSLANSIAPGHPELYRWLAMAGLVLVLLYILSQWREVAASFSGRQARYGSLSLASILLVLGILVAINYVATRQNKRWDLTSNQQFSLSDQTKKVLQGLKEPVKLTVFDRETGFRRFHDRLDSYAYASPQVKVEYVDADKQRALASQFQIQSYGTIIVQYHGRTERVTADAEQDVTNAIVKAVEGQQKRVYFVQGHGEKDITSADDRAGYNQIAAALSRDNFVVEAMVLAQKDEVPADATVVVVPGPTADFLSAEIEKLRRFVNRGGKLLVMLDPPERDEAKPLTNLVAFVHEWGFDVGDDVVLDPVSQTLGMGAIAPVAMSYPSHPITDRFRVLTAFPLARSIAPLTGGANGRIPQTVVETSPQSFAKKDLSALRSGGEVAIDTAKGDKAGPISIAAAVSTPAPDQPAAPAAKPGEPKPADAPKRETRVVVFGDSDFPSNGVLGIPGNADLFLNAVNWLAQQENLISVRAKEPEDRRITLTAERQRFTFLSTVVLIPAIVLGAGLFTWWRRR